MNMRSVGVPRVRTWIWKIMLGYVTTRSFLCWCRIMVVPDCPRCRATEESLDHLVLHCPLSKEVWGKCGRQVEFTFYLISLKRWLSTLSEEGLSSPILQKFIHSVFIYISWEIWKGRNRLLFKSNPFKWRMWLLRQLLRLTKFGCQRWSSSFHHLFFIFGLLVDQEDLYLSLWMLGGYLRILCLKAGSKLILMALYKVTRRGPTCGEKWYWGIIWCKYYSTYVQFGTEC